MSSVYYPAGVPAQQVPLIFVLVNEGQKWRVLPTHADSSGHTFTAHWPHFSSGVLATVDPLFDPLGQLGKRAVHAGKAAGAGAVQIGKDVAAGAATAGQWTWSQVDKAAAWFGDQVTQQMADTARLGLPLVGGSLRDVTCKPAGHDWTFAPLDASGHTAALPVFSGCAGPPDGDRRYPAKIGNHLQYPMLVKLTDDLQEEKESWRSKDLADLIVDLVWAHEHRLVVPGGKEAHLSIADTVPSGSVVKGSVNWAPVLVNVLVIAAMVLTRSESVEAATTLKQLAVGEEDAIWQAQAEGKLLTSDAAEKTGWDSETARAIRASNMTLTGAYVTLGWDLLDAGVCGANALAQTGDEVTGKSQRHPGPRSGLAPARQPVPAAVPGEGPARPRAHRRRFHVRGRSRARQGPHRVRQGPLPGQRGADSPRCEGRDPRKGRPDARLAPPRKGADDRGCPGGSDPRPGSSLRRRQQDPTCGSSGSTTWSATTSSS